MLVLYSDQDNGLSARVKKFWNTETYTVETVTLATSGSTAGNYFGQFVDAYQVTDDSVNFLYADGSEIDLLRVTNLADSILVHKFNTDPLHKSFILYSPTYKVLSIYEFAQNAKGGIVDEFSSYNNTYLISPSALLSSFCEGTTKKEIYYNGTDLAPILYENSVDCGFSPPASNINVFEAKVIRIDHECKSNPVLLKWSNSLGGWDQYMFQYDQEIRNKTEDSAEIKNYVADISTTKSNAFQLGKASKKSMIVGADDLDDNDYNGIVPDLLDSPYVCIVYPIGSGISDLRVMISAGTVTTTTRNKMHSIEFEVKLPDKFTVRN